MPLNMAKFKKTLVYETTGTVKSIQMNIIELRKLDHFCEKKEKFWGIMGGLGIALLIIFTIVLAKSEHGSFFNTISPYTLVLSLIWTIASFITMAVYSRHNYENRRYELIGKLLNSS